MITPPPFDLLTAGGMATLACAVAGAWVWLFGRGERRLTIRLLAGTIVVMAASATAAGSGWLQRMDTTPPPMALMIASVLAAGLALGLSSFGRTSAAAIPLVWLIGFQSFRLPLELVMHRAASLDIMPDALSYSGYNFDIVTGAGALLLTLVMAVGVKVPRAALWAWNIWGLGCLAVITGIAIATSPMVRFFGEAPQVNTWVLFIPYVWLPSVLVVAALFGHVVVTRALMRQASAGPSEADRPRN
jgi:hypothetical protein